jgi:hypothetical protein
MRSTLQNGPVATKTQTVLVDDIDGSDAIATVAFGFQGRSYELDLSAAHLEELKSALQPYIAGARRSGTQQRVTRPVAAGGAAARAARQWAREQGLEVPARGRVPASIVEAWQNR